MILLASLLIACTGEPTPTTPAHTDMAVTPPPAPAPPVPEPLTAAFGPDLAQKVWNIKLRVDAAPSSAELEKAFNDSQAIDLEAAQKIQAGWEAAGGGELKCDAFAPSTPGWDCQLVAEGTAVNFFYDEAYWQAAAKRTPEADDDRFFELLVAVYENAAPTGWAKWLERNWDYGGCSGLGKGYIIDALLKVDAVGTDHFVKDVTETRELALRALLVDVPEFPLCDVETSQAMDNAKIQAEVDRILAEVKLSDDEKAKITARKPLLVGKSNIQQ